MSSGVLTLNVGTLYSHHPAARLGLGKHIEVVPPSHVESYVKVCTSEYPLLSAETSIEFNQGVGLLRSQRNAHQDLNPMVLP